MCCYYCAMYVHKGCWVGEYACVYNMGGELVHTHVCACVLGEVKRTSGIKMGL